MTFQPLQTVPQQGRRMVVNGKLLTYKQTAQFEKFMQDETFRTRFMQLAEAQ